MEDYLNFFQMEDDINFFQMEYDLNFFQMEVNLNFFQMEDDLKKMTSIYIWYERQPQRKRKICSVVHMAWGWQPLMPMSGGSLVRRQNSNHLAERWQKITEMFKKIGGKLKLYLRSVFSAEGQLLQIRTPYFVFE